MTARQTQSARAPQSRADVDGLQRTKLAALLAALQSGNPFYQQKLAGVRFDPLQDPLENLPFTTRDELLADQAAHPPYGTNLTFPLQRYVRLHQTSGTRSGAPLRWLDTAESWAWWTRCWGMIFDAAGVTPEDRFFYPFSFGPFIGFWSAFDGAAARGHLCIPAGGMTSTARLRMLRDNAATVVCCTPTYAQHLAEVAVREEIDLPGLPVRALIVAGEPGGSVPAVRARLEAAWGARVFDHAGMTELGAWGLEYADAPGGLHVIETEFIAECVDPQSGAPVADGEGGELVLTNLGRVGSPLIRYRTGDHVRLLRRHAFAQHLFARVEGGVLGRVDDMLIIRGNNVFPAAIEDILWSIPGVAEHRIEVETRDAMTQLHLVVEPAPGADAAALARNVAEAVRDRLNFRPRVTLADPGALPRFEMKARRIIRTENPST